MSNKKVLLRETPYRPRHNLPREYPSLGGWGGGGIQQSWPGGNTRVLAMGVLPPVLTGVPPPPRQDQEYPPEGEAGRGPGTRDWDTPPRPPPVDRHTPMKIVPFRCVCKGILEVSGLKWGFELVSDKRNFQMKIISNQTETFEVCPTCKKIVCYCKKVTNSEDAKALDYDVTLSTLLCHNVSVIMP